MNFKKLTSVLAAGLLSITCATAVNAEDFYGSKTQGGTTISGSSTVTTAKGTSVTVYAEDTAETQSLRASLKSAGSIEAFFKAEGASGLVSELAAVAGNVDDLVSLDVVDVNIGEATLAEGDSVQVRAKAMAAAGSDARMNGCGLPVVINSGSGNQGITCSVPVLVYGESLNCDIKKIYRALLLSNLTAIYIKAGIGTLSAYCGAVSAGAAAGAGIAYLHGGGYEEIKHTIVNALAIVSGIVCDGAKASCAAKIASSVEAGIVGYYMYLNEQEFCAGEGIVAEGIDRTIENIGILGKEGMKETNKKIIEMMIK